MAAARSRTIGRRADRERSFGPDSQPLTCSLRSHSSPTPTCPPSCFVGYPTFDCARGDVGPCWRPLPGRGPAAGRGNRLVAAAQAPGRAACAPALVAAARPALAGQPAWIGLLAGRGLAERFALLALSARGRLASGDECRVFCQRRSGHADADLDSRQSNRRTPARFASAGRSIRRWLAGRRASSRCGLSFGRGRAKKSAVRWKTCG